MVCGLKPAATRRGRIRGELHSERNFILHAVRNNAMDFFAIVPSPPAIDFPT